MKERKISKKAWLLISCIIILLVVGGICLVLFLPKNTNSAKTVVAEVDTNYSELAAKKDIDVSDVDKALSDYEKQEDGEQTVYTKGNRQVVVKTDENGVVTYLCYDTALAEDEKVEISKFSESDMHIGDDMQQVLALLKGEDYIYHLRTTDENGKLLQVYHYGWESNQTILELVFTEGKLSYYSIHSADIANKGKAENYYKKAH